MKEASPNVFIGEGDYSGKKIEDVLKKMVLARKISLDDSLAR